MFVYSFFFQICYRSVPYDVVNSSRDGNVRDNLRRSSRFDREIKKGRLSFSSKILKKKNDNVANSSFRKSYSRSCPERTKVHFPRTPGRSK